MSWPIVKLGEIFDITSSKRVHEIDWRNEGVPFYRAREVAVLAREGRVNNDLFIEESMYEEFKAKYGVPKAGDLLVTAVGTLGRVYAVQESDRFYFKDASVIWLRARQEVDTSYIQHAMNSTDVQRFIQNSSGATVGTYTISRANETEIPLPPLPEQKRIAAILDKADAIRRKRQQAIQLADDFLRAVFLDMFGDPVTNPKGWPSVKLGDVCGVGSSKRVFVDEFTDSGVPFYRGTEVGVLGQGQQIHAELFISQEHYEDLVRHSGAPGIGDLLLPSICHDGRIWKVNHKEQFYFKDGRVLWIKVNRELIDSDYLRSYLQRMFLSNYSAIASGTTFAELKIVNLKAMNILSPPLALQRKFSELVKAISESGKLYANADLEGEDLFSSLAKQAFSGQL